MRKIDFIIALFFVGNLAMAQTSVWHGGREMWTRGEGTEENPYLIENADQLAMLSYAVNKGYYMSDLHFKLTTDIDLNGSEDQPWFPIGLAYYSEDGCERKKEYDTDIYFMGNFDGGGHAISNIYVDSKTRAGLFGYVHSADTVVLKNIRIVNGYIKGELAGGIVGYAGKVVISECYNAAEIYGNQAGGISGRSGFIERCYNIGKVSATGAVGGITPMLGGFIRQCYNSGEVISEGNIAGGIAGISMDVHCHSIENCYNTGAVTVLSPDTINTSGCGGIVGFLVANRISLHNCYNVGSVVGNEGLTGGIVGSEVEQDSVLNCYYLNTCGAQGLGIAMDEDAMRTPDFVATLNDNTDVWNMDEDNHNNGFPILMNLDMAVDEVSEKDFVVYPNPTQGILRIEGGHIEEVEVFNVLGVKVMQRSMRSCDGTATLDVSTLADGFYLLRVVDSQKAYRSCPFVVRH